MVTDFSAIRQLYHIGENNGFSDDEILMYQKPCANLPSALLDYYRQLGKYNFNQAQDKLLAPNVLRLSQNRQFLIFYQENQLACVWAIAIADLAKDNPPVYINSDEKFDASAWQIECPALTDFFTAMAYLQAIFALPFYCEDFLFIDESEFQIITKQFLKKPAQLNVWTKAEFYGDHPDDVIYIAKSNEEICLSYASFNKNQFAKLDEILGNFGE